jgi:GntR family transcriptional regulator
MEDPQPIDKDSPEYVWRQVANAIAADIASGRLPVGARLTGERALAEAYGVAVGTVRRAVQDLRDRGLVITVPARGTFVVGTPGEE